MNVYYTMRHHFLPMKKRPYGAAPQKLARNKERNGEKTIKPNYFEALFRVPKNSSVL